jgi:hypothetical protein
MSNRIAELLGSYRAARNCRDAKAAQLADLKAALSGQYERENAVPRLHSDEDFLQFFPGFIYSLKDRPGLQSAMREGWADLQGLLSEVNDLSGQLTGAAQSLREEIGRLQSHWFSELSARRAEMMRAAMNALTPLCDTVQKAESLAKQCDKVQALEMQIGASQSTRLRDLESLAESFISYEPASAGAAVGT